MNPESPLGKGKNRNAETPSPTSPSIDDGLRRVELEVCPQRRVEILALRLARVEHLRRRWRGRARAAAIVTLRHLRRLGDVAELQRVADAQHVGRSSGVVVVAAERERGHGWGGCGEGGRGAEGAQVGELIDG